MTFFLPIYNCGSCAISNIFYCGIPIFFSFFFRIRFQRFFFEKIESSSFYVVCIQNWYFLYVKMKSIFFFPDNRLSKDNCTIIIKHRGVLVIIDFFSRMGETCASFFRHEFLFLCFFYCIDRLTRKCVYVVVKD